MRRVDVAYVLIYKENEEKILMVNNVGAGWTLPGGAVEKEETLEQAAIRDRFNHRSRACCRCD
jgi:8-oxo-dGTP diphosphatase